jgi:hypothetical protein
MPLSLLPTNHRGKIDVSLISSHKFGSQLVVPDVILSFRALVYQLILGAFFLYLSLIL